jgi:hypothetical protein
LAYFPIGKEAFVRLSVCPFSFFHCILLFYEPFCKSKVLFQNEIVETARVGRMSTDLWWGSQMDENP